MKHVIIDGKLSKPTSLLAPTIHPRTATGPDTVVSQGPNRYWAARGRFQTVAGREWTVERLLSDAGRIQE